MKSPRVSNEELDNSRIFKDLLSSFLLEESAFKNSKGITNTKNSRKAAIAEPAGTLVEKNENLDQGIDNAAEELAEFIDYIALETFTALPLDLRRLTHATYTSTATIRSLYTPPLSVDVAGQILNALDPGIFESLTTYGLLGPSDSEGSTALSQKLITRVLNEYLETLTTKPLIPSRAQTRDAASACEICGRDWINLTFHHLIPRFVHAKAVKRGWHAEDELQSGAWLCRACHSFVHRVASHEELAREYYTVEKLLEREDVRKFAGWVGRVRWKTR